MDKEKLKKMFAVCDEVRTNTFWFVRKRDLFVMYEDGLEVDTLTEEQAAKRLLHLTEVYEIKAVKGILYTEEAIKW
jgi:hypothetical protein